MQCDGAHTHTSFHLNEGSEREKLPGFYFVGFSEVLQSAEWNLGYKQRAKLAFFRFLCR